MSEPHPIELLSDEAFGWYFTGLTDGEGSFCIAYVTPKRDRPKWTLSFSIGMRADELKHIQAVQKRLRCGGVYVYPTKGGCPAFRFSIQKLRDLVEIIIPQFDRFPLQFKKSNDFKIWREAVLFSKRIRRGSRGGKPVYSFEENEALRFFQRQLMAVRVYTESEIDLPRAFVDARPVLPFPDENISVQSLT